MTSVCLLCVLISMIAVLFLFLFYLPTTVMLFRNFSLDCDLAAILGHRGDNTLCILFSHLNKVIQIHQLCG